MNHIPYNGKCPTCSGVLLRMTDVFWWNLKPYHGYVCQSCRSNWDDPEDSFAEAILCTPQKKAPISGTRTM